MSGILFASVKKGHACLDRGHWFFHEGEWTVCASAGNHEAGDWEVLIFFEKFNKPLGDKSFRFASLEQAKNFVSQYFEDPVVDW